MTPMEYHSGKCRFETAPGRVEQDGPCRVALDVDHLIIAPEGQPPHSLYYSDIDRLTAEDYAVQLLLHDGPRCTLYFLGRYYGQFVADLRGRRSAQLIRNLLMLDAEPQKEFRGACTRLLPDGERQEDPACTITLYRSSLVVEPSGFDPWNLAYNDITAMSFNREAYRLELQTDLGEQLSFAMLGTRFGELEQEIRRLTDQLQERTARLLAERLPEATPRGPAAIATVLLQGRAVPLPVVQQAAPGLWPELEQLLFAADEGEVDEVRRTGFQHLCRLASPEHVFIGLREPFESTGENPRPLFWFIIAYPERQVMAVEVTNESGYATYLYAMEGPVDQAVRELNRAMVALNFRREVISASEQELASERLARYRVALRKLPHLRRLRHLFRGRVAHTSEEAWRRGVEAALGAG
ncbi:MAG: hypothetical protein ACOY93_22485 [Bacillota bacterium]